MNLQRDDRIILTNQVKFNPEPGAIFFHNLKRCDVDNPRFVAEKNVASAEAFPDWHSDNTATVPHGAGCKTKFSVPAPSDGLPLPALASSLIVIVAFCGNW